MELPARVLVYNQLLGLNKHPATLVSIRPEGYYELRLQSQDGRQHLTLIPVTQSAVVFAEAEAEVPPEMNIER